MSLTYLDSSALIKRIFDEPDSGAFRTWLAQDKNAGNQWISSELADIEIARSCLRAGLGDDDRELALSGVSTHTIDDRVIRRARTVGDRHLRSLDAIHLATALLVGVDAIVAYDARLAEAARAAGLQIFIPGSD